MRFLSTLISAIILSTVHSFAASIDSSADLAAREPLPNPEPELLELAARGSAKATLPRGWSTVSECTADGGNQRVFPAKQGKDLSTQRHVILDNTPEKCAARCAQDGYGYAAVRMGVECFCSRQQPKIASKSEKQCNYACPGNSRLTCGSFGTSQVYVNFSVAGKRAPKVGAPRLQNGWSVAFKCIVDPTVGEKYLKGTDVFELKNNSPLACTTLCGQKGYDLAGVEYSNECMCGHDWKGASRPATRPASECYMACSGDKSLTCGAGNRVQFYKHKSFRRYNSTIEFEEPEY